MHGAKINKNRRTAKGFGENVAKKNCSFMFRELYYIFMNYTALLFLQR